MHYENGMGDMGGYGDVWMICDQRQYIKWQRSAGVWKWSTDEKEEKTLMISV